MYFYGLRIVLLLVLVLAQHVFSLDMQLFNQKDEFLEYVKTHMPAIYPQLKTYVPPPKDRSACPKPVPGVRKLFQGVDITNFDFYPKDGFSQGFKSTVLAMSCKRGASWYDTAGRGFDKPDQMLHGINKVGAGTGTETVKIFKSSSDVRKEMTKTASLSAGLGAFSFSSSVSYKSMEQTIQKRSSFIQEVSSYEATARAINSIAALDKHAQAFVDNKLIGPFETNRTLYEKFIEKYGTHYFVRGNLGGMIKAIIETKSDLLTKSKGNDLSVSAKATYSSLVKSGSISFGLEKGKSSTNTNFNEASSTSIKYFGGSANLLMAKGFTSWQPTVDGDPWVVEGELKPIYHLIKDRVKRKSMKLAVKKHVYRSYYKELIRSRNGASITVGKIINDIQKMSEIMITGQKKEKLEKLIEYHFVKPDWFSSSSICYGSRKEKEMDHRCVNPNMLRINYKWHTYVNGGGSKDLVYSLKTKSYPKPMWYYKQNNIDIATVEQNLPDWFNKVKLCVRYQGDKDTSCKGSGEECADLNTYTSLTYNETAGAKADCNLSWKLSIPNDAPVWLDETKLCFSYGVHGDISITSKDLVKQCNRAVNPEREYEMCAAPNQWTPYWRDGTTKDTQGKCWMRLMFKSLTQVD